MRPFSMFFGLLIGSFVVSPAPAGMPLPLDALLERAKIVYIGKVVKHDEKNLTIALESRLRGDPGAGPMAFGAGDYIRDPAVGSRYFVFSQGNDHWGGPRDRIRQFQEGGGQASYTGWYMFLIEKKEGKEYVRGAFASKRYKNVPLTLEQSKKLARESSFNPENPKREGKGTMKGSGKSLVKAGNK